jgi:hypothetical protein
VNVSKKAAALLAAVTVTFSFAANAQVSEDGMGKVVPVELYACSLNDGRNMDDLEEVIEDWNEFMDGDSVRDYAAWTLRPYFYGTEQEFDFIWMGAFTDGNAMGDGFQRWITEGGEIAEDFDKVATCFAHIMLGSAQYKAPPDNRTPESSIISMMDCKMNEGVEYETVRAAELKWAEYGEENDSKAGTWHWYPNYGGGDSDYDYKVVSAYEDFGAFGSDWEQFANGGGREASMGIFDDVDECDDARVYLATSVRAAQLR